MKTRVARAQPPDGVARRSTWPRRRILFLSRWFPLPADNGSKLRIYNLLRGLAPGFETTLISFDGTPTTDHYLPELQAICRSVHVVPLRPFNPASVQARLGYLSRTPRSVVDTYSHEMAERIQAVAALQKPDLIIASQLGTAVYHRSFRDVPAVFEEVEVGLFHQRYRQAGSLRGRLRSGLTWWKHRRFLADLLHRFKRCTVVSAAEKELLLRIDPGHPGVEVVPNCVNLADYAGVQEQPRPNTLIFTGSFSYDPNYEAMLWFLEKVYPRIRARLPAVNLTVTGDHGHRPLPASPGVTLTGSVDDVRPWIARSAVSVVPILSGGGTRLKILEAMALRTPVVTTSKGAEGLPVEPGSSLLIADTPEQFAENVVRLLTEPDLRRQLVTQAYQMVQDRCDWSVVMPRFIDLVEATLDERGRQQ